MPPFYLDKLLYKSYWVEPKIKLTKDTIIKKQGNLGKILHYLEDGEKKMIL